MKQTQSFVPDLLPVIFNFLKVDLKNLKNQELSSIIKTDSNLEMLFVICLIDRPPRLCFEIRNIINRPLIRRQEKSFFGSNFVVIFCLEIMVVKNFDYGQNEIQFNLLVDYHRFFAMRHQDEKKISSP